MKTSSVSSPLSCPLVNGYGVYTARALYAGYDHTYYFEDVELCEQAGFFKTNEAEAQAQEDILSPSAYLYYETKTGQAMVAYHIAEDDEGTVEIFNLLGQPIANSKIYGNNRIVYIDIPPVASGEYFYRIKTKNRFNTYGKFLIIH